MADPGGANPAMDPLRNCQWSLAPLRDRKSNGSIVILSKSKDFGPSVAMLATDLAPLWKNTIENNDLKKGHQKFWEIDEFFSGNA